MKYVLMMAVLIVIGCVKQADAQEATTEETVSSPAFEEENWCEENCTILPVLLPPPPAIAPLDSDITIVQ